MTIAKQDIDAVLTRLAETFPQTFVLSAASAAESRDLFRDCGPLPRISPGAIWSRL